MNALRIDAAAVAEIRCKFFVLKDCRPFRGLARETCEFRDFAFHIVVQFHPFCIFRR